MIMQGLLNNSEICLRAPEPEDLEMLYAMENDTSIWMVSYNAVPYSRFQLKKYIAESSHDLFADRQVRFMIERVSDRTVMGCADLTDIEPLHARAQVGIAVGSEYRNHGVAKMAVSLLCDYCQKCLRLRQLYAIVPLNNNLSEGLFSTCGFEKSAILKDWLWNESKYQDAWVFQRFF